MWAIPIIGGVIKIISLIPVGIELIVLALVMWILSMINSLVVLFTGKYWDTAFDLFVGVVTLATKTMLFWTGVTNAYPGFGFDIKKEHLFTLSITKPAKPNRILAIPLLGFIFRVIVIIPFNIWQSIVGYGAQIGAWVSSFVVLFTGKYPESTYELVRDGERLKIAASMWLMGVSDGQKGSIESYPNFWISFNHKVIKIILLVLGALLLLGNYSNNSRRQQYNNQMYYQNNGNYNYQMPQNSGNGGMMQDNSNTTY